ncbi:hypothetical protein BT93_L2898 [Corymbia citriodora subsp. variegata]|uniref:Germin-like protein n=1 Tax=Corymbia citriodora subsp. variegata TaxID=360336 RepID=A0A8T0CIW3_CORYI|nr:hypothetical protein BT93_L2898 [Corymbia citriodora subsp. variegata]
MANFLLLCVLSIVCTITVASEPSPLQDFCVADLTSSTRVNGFSCLDAKQAQDEHFFFSGLHLAGTPVNAFGSSVTPVSVGQIPGLNTLGISLARIDFTPEGLVPPHMHPRASEILTVLKGTILVGFVTSNPDNKLISKVLHKGDVFVFPIGLVHFQKNVGSANAVSISAFSGQNPGLVLVPNTVFGSDPSIANDILAKAFQTDKAVVDQIQGKI